MRKNLYVCALSVQTAPELLSLAKAFYPIEQRLGLKPIDVEEVKEMITKIDPSELTKWTPFIRQLDKAEAQLPYVVRNHFINRFITPGLAYGDTFEQILMTLNFAKEIGLIEFDKVPHPQSGGPVTTLRLVRDNPMVKAVLASSS